MILAPVVRRSTLDDLLDAQRSLSAASALPDQSQRPPSGGPGAVAWVGAILYALFGLVSAALLGVLLAPFAFACVCGSLCVALSPLFVPDERRVAGTLLIASGVLIGGSWGFLIAAFGAETYAQLVITTLICAAFVGWPPVLVGAMLMGRGADTSR
jgi:hypothetical protein